MASLRADSESGREGSSRPYLIVSGDSHAGPSLERQLRPYCPTSRLEEFDEFVRGVRRGPAMGGSGTRPVDSQPHAEALDPKAREAGLAALQRIRKNPGSMDPEARLRDMDAEGVAVEVIFAGAQNHEVLPWAGSFDAGSAAVGGDLRALGARIWNEWLADFCSAAPERLLGVAQVPIWDIDAAVREVRWAADHGLRALNFPAPRQDYPPYNEKDVYERFWSAVADVDLPLVTHSASGERTGLSGHGAVMVWLSEVLWLSRRGLSHLIFGGVFDRHPGLKVAFVEQRGNWVLEALGELESVYVGVPKNAALPLEGALVDKPERSPREYWHANCILVASFMAPYEAAMRHDIGIETIMWGSDYPHLEGTWPRTRLALRNTFAGIPEHDVRAMLGGNGVRVFNVDTDVLQPIADRIGPRPEEIAKPLGRDEGPAYHGLAFREAGSFH